MKEKITYAVYRIIRFFIWLFYPEIKSEGTGNLPDEAVIAVGNHAKMNGPISCELYFPREHSTWTAGQMMKLREVPDYAYTDFWGEKPAYIKWAFRILSYIIAPLAVCIFNNAKCIGVYHDTRLLSTFRDTVRKLEEGTDINFFVGCAVNAAYQDDDAYGYRLKMRLVDQLVDCLEKMHKSVKVSYF